MNRIMKAIVVGLAFHASASMADQQDDACVAYGKIADAVWMAKHDGLNASMAIAGIQMKFNDLPGAKRAGIHFVKMIYVDQPKLSEDGVIHLALLECNMAYQK
jgi:hypothetical protein